MVKSGQKMMSNDQYLRETLVKMPRQGFFYEMKKS